MNNQILKCGDVVFVNLPSHSPKGHEQEGRRPAVIVGVPLGDVRYPVVVVVPLTTQLGDWIKKNPELYPILQSGTAGLPQKSVVLCDQIMQAKADRSMRSSKEVEAQTIFDVERDHYQYQDIVLGFQPARVRSATEFAVG